MRTVIKESDIVGVVYGKLTAIKEVNQEKEYRSFQCLCECGVTSSHRLSNLRGGIATSCGCSRKHNTNSQTHGYRKHKLYSTWSNIRERCYNEGSKDYGGYGCRGIKLFDAWMESPIGFIKYIEQTLGKKPSGSSLDRINNDKGYEPNNLKWSTAREQSNNTRANRIITYKNESMTSSQWARKLGVNSKSIESRLRRGWSVERSLTQPLRKSS